jgi:4-amino-4-deoxy-L-arabinose transferase-like glycosyltransferase
VKASEEARLLDLVARHYRTLAIAVLALAAFNLTYRLGLVSVEEWDESLYATTAWEMLQHGNPIATTFDGDLDYYNSKPPLNVWLLAASFKTFGVNLVSMRVISAAAAWLTVFALQVWTKRLFGPMVALLASLVLSTTFGFLHLHSGRSGNADALLTLLILLIVITLSAARHRPWQRAWLGPLLAGVFLLKGMAVLMPLAISLVAAVWARAPRPLWKPLIAAAILFAVPTAAWAAARWQLDGWRFFDRMFYQDFVALASTAVEERTGGALYYIGVLQRYQYDWLLAALGAAFLAWRSWPQIWRALWVSLKQRQPTPVLLTAWALGTLLLPTLVQTKVVWYLNPFYPLFAILVGSTLANVAFNGHLSATRRPLMLAGVLIVAAVTSAQARSMWRIHVVTNLNTSVQGVLLAKRARFYGSRVSRDRLQRGEAFVVRAMMRGTFRVMSDASQDGRPMHADLLILSQQVHDDRLRPVGSADGHFLYEPAD